MGSKRSFVVVELVLMVAVTWTRCTLITSFNIFFMGLSMISHVLCGERISISVLLVLAETRKQVMEATERLGGQYSPNLHPQCTHLVVQISFILTFQLN